MCQLAGQTEVVLFTLEWGITTKSLKAISNSVRLFSINGDYNISCLSCYVQTYFIFLEVHALPYCFLFQLLKNIKIKHEYDCIYVLFRRESLLVKWTLTHVGPVPSHRTTTSWTCCSCWWLWCLNILVPWSRLLTSATGFGKRGRLISARVSTAFFRFTIYF